MWVSFFEMVLVMLTGDDWISNSEWSNKLLGTMEVWVSCLLWSPALVRTTARWISWGVWSLFC